VARKNARRGAEDYNVTGTVERGIAESRDGGKAGDGRKGEEEEGAREGRNGTREEERQGARSDAT